MAASDKFRITMALNGNLSYLQTINWSFKKKMTMKIIHCSTCCDSWPISKSSNAEKYIRTRRKKDQSDQKIFRTGNDITS